MKKLCFCIIALGFVFQAISQTTVIPFLSSWKYLDNGSNQATAWRAISFNDAGWNTGAAQLGYGDGDEATVVSFGSNTKKKYPTTYFRKTVSISNPAAFSSFTLGLKRDDGAVVYVNGTEVFRSNMPTGVISYTSKASSAAADDGNTVQNATLASSVFVNGNNTIAVEVHQFNAADADLSFDLQLTGNTAPANVLPVANAGADQTITLPANASLSAALSSDADGTINSYLWNKISGPASGAITSPSAVNTMVSSLVQGVYTFRVTVTDNSGAIATDDVVITVNAGSNMAPTAYAGNDQSITLPANSVSLSAALSADADGTISNYVWSKLSGPVSGSITSPSAVNTTVTGLVQGLYTFRVTVTDNGGATATDDVVITVNAAVTVTSYTAISYGTSWKYLDNGSDQGTAWRGTGFSDAAWVSGNAQLGYGDGDESTVISFGANSSAKYTTSYFRKVISISSPALYLNFTLNIKRDDGAVVYVNGVEVYRSNMPTGTVTYTTLATAAASDDGNTIQTASIASSFFANGNNTIAVEMHQNAGSSTDLSFDLELKANAPGSPSLTRGPYLQMANETAVTLRWRTDQASDSKISVGTAFGNYTASAVNATVATEHEIRIAGLIPDTKYYYSFGSTTQVLQAATSNYFTTAPGANTTRKIRIAAYGDCGRNSNGFQSGTLSAYQNYVGSSPAEIMLLLGDNAYDNGTDLEYTSNFFNAYSGNILKNHVVFPSPGNHDYANSSSRQTDHNVPYYNIFNMPTAAECGGVASGTEAFYSYNWGNIHFLSLDSYGYETGSTRLYDTLGPQATWVKNDLAANTSKWTVAYWHHPPYTMGSHNSDTETELVNMRQKFIGIMERYGVDMIICGHSHDYERSYLLKGYTGNEASFSVGTNAVSSSSGKYDGSANSCPYNVASGQVNHGTVYVVAGSAGADGGVQAGYPHNALPFSVDDGGMLYLEVENNRLDAKFLRRDGTVADKFTILKDAGKTTNINSNSGDPVILTASWQGSYLWSNGATTQSITVNPTTTTNYTCTDGSSCITDNFTVTINAPVAQLSLKKTEVNNQSFTAYPIPVKKGNTLHIISGPTPSIVMLYNDKGQKISQFKVQHRSQMSTTHLNAGMYYLKTAIAGKKVSKKILVMD
ncbi:MAG: metallophosphoesterase [Bacteroidota bacterium]